MENKTEVEIENKVYRLEEMYDSMKDSIDNVNKVIDEQRHLLDVIKSAHDERFDAFVKASEEQIDNLVSQVKTLSYRMALLMSVIVLCKDDEEKAKCVSTFIAAIGMFDEEKKDE